MRHSAATAYATSLKGVTIRELRETPPYDQLNHGTLERWCVEDEWVKCRQKYFQEVRAEIESRISEKLVRVHVRQLEKMEDIADQLADEILTNKVEAKSKEGLVTAMVRLLESQDGLREKLAQIVVPAHLGGVEQESLPLVPKVTPEEARAGAKAILQRRRLQARQRVQQEREGEEKPESGKKPNLRVVKEDEHV